MAQPFRVISSYPQNSAQHLTAPIAGDQIADSPVPVGWVRLQPEDRPEIAVVVELGDTVPDVTQGYSGWSAVQIQKGKAIANWDGFDLMGIPLDLYVDGLESGTIVDDVYDNLEAMAGRGRKKTGGEPPKLIVDTAGLMRHDATVFPSTRWVISDLAWSTDPEESVTDDAGHRMRAVCSVTLLEFNDATRLQDRALASRLAHQAKSKGGKRVYTARQGDTLISIARAKLGDPGRWQQLATLNNIRDPLGIRAGARIRLPS